jgi:hypothetical protein
MRKVLTASIFVLFGLMSVPASAMPFASLNNAAAGMTPVAYGCGPGRTRGPYGGCHAMGYGVAGPRVYGAYGYHPYAHPYARRYGYHPYYRRY